MPDLEFEFNPQHRDLILSQTDGTGTFGGEGDYIRLTIYPSTGVQRIVQLTNSEQGIDGSAIFFSTLSQNSFFVNIHPFRVFSTDLEDSSNRKFIGNNYNDFKIYQNGNDIYIKPNEIFNTFGLPQGNYRIQIDFLNQLRDSSPMPYWFEDFNVNQDLNVDGLDAVQWSTLGREDISATIAAMETGNIPLPPKYSDWVFQNAPDTGPDGETVDISPPSPPPLGTEYYVQNMGLSYNFIIKEISTSRKEVRLKILNNPILNGSPIITKLTDAFNNFEPQLLNDGSPNPNYKYQFKHVLNIGTGDHIPIMNYAFDSVTDGKNNQSIILKLYEPIPINVGNFSGVTIEREVLTTLTQEAYYFSDVGDLFLGDGLNPDTQENWINPDNNNFGYQSLDELAISASIGDIEINSLISSSEYNYPNLNTDFNEFENHTFFGSAKKKLQNFKTKVETIQGYYSEISSSLVVSSSIVGDSSFVIQKRKDLFNKINEEFKTFSPYERFLYFDGQTDSTASAPSLKNYAHTTPVQLGGDQVEGVELNQHNGFSVVYKHSSEKVSGRHNQFIDLFTNKYKVENKPFFNYSSSIYLSFLLQGDSGSSLTWENNNKNQNPPLPQDTLYQNNILNPDMTASKYQRYIFQASMSYFVPNTTNNDMADLTGSNFNAGSPTITILNNNIKTGSSQIKDSTGLYPTTFITSSHTMGIPFSGSIMPAGELFRIYNKNTLSSSLQGYWNIDDVTSGSSLSLANVVNDAGPTTGDATDILGVTASAGVEVHGRQYGSSYFMISESGFDTGVHFDSTDFNFNKDDNFSLSVWVKRFHPNTGSADPTVPSSTTAQGILIRGNAENSYGIEYRHSSNQFRCGVRPTSDGNTKRLASHTMTDDGLNWHHVVMTYESASATGIKLYVDGVLEASTTNVTDGTGATMGDFSASNANADVGEKLSLGGDDILAGSRGVFNGFLQYPRVYNRTITAEEVNQLYLNPPGVTETKITDVKVTLKDPTNVLPFDNIFKTTSTEFTDWYNNALTQAETFDTDNIHSFENNLPLYIQESSEYNDMKDFLKLQGEQYDLIRNHIDSMGTIHKRGYKKTNSPPDNTLPMLLSNMGWQAINPFSGSLTDTLGSYLSGVTSIDDIKNNTWRKTLNNLLYIYKSKGTKNSVRALLNTYGYPPDVLEFQEFGGATSEGDNDSILDDSIPNPANDVDTDLAIESGSISFTDDRQKLYRYIFNGKKDRILNLDWWMDDANLNTIELVYKHVKTTQTQTLLKSSGSGNETLWDLRLVPSADGVSSSFEFRLNNSQVADTSIGSRGFSMSLAYNKMTDGQLWNVMVQRMTSSISGTGIQEYRLHSAFQDRHIITPYSYATMSVSGGLVGGSSTEGGKGFYANQNFQSSGSRHPLSSSNLFVGETLSGSLAEVKGWSTALSISKFRQHTLNKFSAVGNTINAHRTELVYHFKLNENYTTSSVSASGQNLTIVDSSPATTYSDYSITKDGGFFTSSIIYGFDYIDVVHLSTHNNGDTNTPNDNSVLISPNYTIVGNLHPEKPAIDSLVNVDTKKPPFNTSPMLELYRSPQTFVDNFILDNIAGFNLENLYGSPLNYYSQSYDEFDTFRENFFESHPITIDTNKFIRAHEDMFNHSIIEGLKTVVPARSTFSDENSKVGIEIRPTMLEKQKYENEKHSVEQNPNTFTASISPSPDLSNSEFVQPKSGSININVTNVSTYEQPKSASISVNVTNVATYERPKSASINTLPSLNDSTYEATKNGTIDYSAHSNKSFENIHDSWGTSSADTHFINYAAGTGSRGDYNVGHIDTRVVFHMIGDNEYYSSSNASEFTNHNNFYNHLQINDGPAKNVFYTHFIASGNVLHAAHEAGKLRTYNGLRMGKTRFMRVVGNVDNIPRNVQLILPRNHVTKFSNPFKERMIDGTQNTNPGFLNVQHEDYSTSSFYRVNVTGGENSIYVKGSNNPTKGENDKIIY